MENILPSTVQRAVEFAAKTLRPQKIYLFGSRARGDARPNSDFDFCIVLDGVCPLENWTKFLLDVRELPLTLHSMDWLRWDELDVTLQKIVIQEGALIYEKG